MASRKAEKERLRQERLARERELAAASRRRRMLQVYGGGAVAVVVAAIVVVLVVLGGSGSSGASGNGGSSAPKVATVPIKTLASVQPAPSPGPLGPEGIPIPKNAAPLASNSSTATGNTIDGIQCNAGEKLVYHVHTHLTIFVNGAERQIPYGIGIVPPRQVQNTASGPFVAGGSCFYWLHTHAADGIVHIESPSKRTYTLGNFFDIWHQPLSANQVGPVKGKVTAFYNGQVYKDNPRDIPLGSHTQVQLDVGKPVIAPEKVSFGGTGL
ncbi:MAG TPA: hypothetical protein VFB39_11520 [Solirubrobacteraceae bacterium]|nr:hypothetical protein [Solirubrobacteraceae bacterium]